jgi:hypothetical protein
LKQPQLQLSWQVEYFFMYGKGRSTQDGTRFNKTSILLSVFSLLKIFCWPHTAKTKIFKTLSKWF